MRRPGGERCTGYASCTVVFPARRHSDGSFDGKPSGAVPRAAVSASARLTLDSNTALMLRAMRPLVRPLVRGLVHRGPLLLLARG